MQLASILKLELEKGLHGNKIVQCYGRESENKQRERMISLLASYIEIYGDEQVALISAPGRTELGGNHTDHQKGCILAGSVNVDVLAVAGRAGQRNEIGQADETGQSNKAGQVVVRSQGFEPIELDSADTDIHPEEAGTTKALIRGMIAGVKKRGYLVDGRQAGEHQTGGYETGGRQAGGFHIAAVSDIPVGAGVSSSAAFEVLIGQVLNHLYCNDELSSVDIAEIAQETENIYFGKPCGLMDQLACSVVGVVAVDFAKGREGIVPVDFDWDSCGHELCIIETGGSHADLTDEYASIPEEMKAIASFFGKNVLNEVDEDEFLKKIPELRRQCGDRSVLRAHHFFEETKRAVAEKEALEANKLAEFFQLVKASGQSSYMQLQNIYCNETPNEQPVAIALCLAEAFLEGKGAVRVHGGGFAGTIQAWVPEKEVEHFVQRMNDALGFEACHRLKIRALGGTVVI